MVILPRKVILDVVCPTFSAKISGPLLVNSCRSVRPPFKNFNLGNPDQILVEFSQAKAILEVLSSQL